MIDLFPRAAGPVALLLTAEDCRAQCRVDGADEDDRLPGCGHDPEPNLT